jgi:4-hydroxy-tetrahydrodipicolinate synthase
MTELAGVLAAVATPFDADLELDEARLRRLVDALIAGGVHGLVPGGSTGEFAQLTVGERKTLLEIVIDQAAGRVPVVAHTGAMTSKEAVYLSRHAEAAGSAALLVLPPYKDRLSVEETSDFFRAVADSVALPVVVYNLPLATGVNLTPEDIVAMNHLASNIRYVKDTAGDYHQVTRLIHDYGDVLTTLVGWDTMLLAALIEGAKGCILGATNVIASRIVKIYDSVQNNDLAAARQEWDAVYPMMRFLLSGGYVTGVKGALDVFGDPIGSSRPPVSSLSAERRAEVGMILKALELTP